MAVPVPTLEEVGVKGVMLEDWEGWEAVEGEEGKGDLVVAWMEVPRT